MSAARRAAPGDADALAAIHGRCFWRSWEAAAIAALLAEPSVDGWITADARGFILVRTAGDEAEILTLAVDPAARRSGLGRALVLAGLAGAAARGAETAFLEVAEDAGPALFLYESLRFRAIARRGGYYQREGGARVDAIVMARALEC